MIRKYTKCFEGLVDDFLVDPRGLQLLQAHNMVIVQTVVNHDILLLAAGPGNLGSPRRG
jgi:hypothetical protein